MHALARLVAKASGLLSRLLGRGGGTTLPGVVLLRLQPTALTDYGARLDRGRILCSATNGKTTTTQLIAAALRGSGHEVASNVEGSNLARGVAAALLDAPAQADTGVFEVDEAALEQVAAEMYPSVIVLMNLFRDQLDRYGELETLVDRWLDIAVKATTRARPATLVLNADDPNIAAIGREVAERGAQSAVDIVWFGLDTPEHARDRRSHAADATTCRRCGGAIVHDVVLVGHLGHWRCSNCDAKRPVPHVVATQASFADGPGQTALVTIGAHLLDDATPRSVIINSPLRGLHNTYNLTAAVAAVAAHHHRADRPIDTSGLGVALSETAPAFGRGELVQVGDKTIELLLAKNPTGVNQNIATLLAAGGGHGSHVLAMLNDRTADGRDVSWIWDVDWEPLLPELASLTLSGDRATDLGLRFRYAGADMSGVALEADPATALDQALARVPSGETLHVLPTYTAMLDLREVLTERGHTVAYWDKA